jgi:hypothetical protein
MGAYFCAIRLGSRGSFSGLFAVLLLIACVVSDIISRYDVNDVFCNVGGVIADAFKAFRHEDAVECGHDVFRFANHLRQQLLKKTVAQSVHLIVPPQHRTGDFEVASCKCSKAIAQHRSRQITYPENFYAGCHKWPLQHALGCLRDVHCLVPNTFQFIVDAPDRQSETQVDRNQLVTSDQLQHAGIHFDLDLIDGHLFVHDSLGGLFVGLR